MSEPTTTTDRAAELAAIRARWADADAERGSVFPTDVVAVGMSPRELALWLAARADIAALLAIAEAAMREWAADVAALQRRCAAAEALMHELLKQPRVVRTPELDRLLDAYNAVRRAAESRDAP